MVLNKKDEWPEQARGWALLITSGVFALYRFSISGHDLTPLGSLGAIAVVLAGALVGVLMANPTITFEVTLGDTVLPAKGLIVAAAILVGIVGGWMAIIKLQDNAPPLDMLYQIAAHLWVGALIGFGLADRRTYMLILAGGLIIVEVAAFTIHLMHG